MACFATNIAFWEDFIDLYRDLPELWQVKSERYKIKHLKLKAYEILLDKYKELEPYANVEGVKRKINNLRSCYRRELRKVKTTERSGCGTDDVYVPSLWYFNKLDFLREQEIISDTISSEDISNETDEVSFKKIIPKKKFREELLKKAALCLKESEPEDKASILAASWAALYRKLSPEQQNYCNRVFNEALFQGLQGNLTQDSLKTLEPISQFTPFCTNESSQVPAFLSTPTSTKQFRITRVPNTTQNKCVSSTAFKEAATLGTTNIPAIKTVSLPTYHHANKFSQPRTYPQTNTYSQTIGLAQTSASPLSSQYEDFNDLLSEEQYSYVEYADEQSM